MKAMALAEAEEVDYEDYIDSESDHETKVP